MTGLAKDFPFLKDNDLDPELKKILLEKLLEERAQTLQLSVKQTERRESDDLEKKKLWLNTPLVVTLVGTITIFANGLVAYVQSQQAASNSITLEQLKYQLKERDERSDSERQRQLAQLKNELTQAGADADATRVASKDERDFAYKTIEKELAKTDDARDRARVLLFLVRAGLLKGLDRKALEEMAMDDLEGHKAPLIPPTVGRPDVPQYNIPTPPVNPAQTHAATTLLRLAVNEINKNIHEATSSSRIAEYFRVAGSDFVSADVRTVPWSAAFLSWLISQTGNPIDLKLSTAHFSIWNDAVTKKLTFRPGEKQVLPGDIIVKVRAGQSVADIRAGKSHEFLGQSGVVYSINGDEISSIQGNVGDAIRLTKDDIKNDTLIGFIRLADSLRSDK